MFIIDFISVELGNMLSSIWFVCKCTGRDGVLNNLSERSCYG